MGVVSPRFKPQLWGDRGGLLFVHKRPKCKLTLNRSLKVAPLSDWRNLLITDPQDENQAAERKPEARV